MSSVTISHKTRNEDVTVSTSAPGSSAIACGDLAGGVVFVVGVTASATLVIHTGNGATFAPAFDAAGQAATVTVPAEGGAMALPDAIYAARYFKLTSSEPLATTASVVVSLKS